MLNLIKKKLIKIYSKENQNQMSNLILWVEQRRCTQDRNLIDTRVFPTSIWSFENINISNGKSQIFIKKWNNESFSFFFFCFLQ